MTLPFHSLRLVVTLAVAGSTAVLAPHAQRHLHLLKSEPKANDTLATAPTALKFWFSESPELAVTSVKLWAVGGAPVALAPVAKDSGGKAIMTSIKATPLTPGTYGVSWKTTATDGHPSSGTYQFVVTAAH